MRRTRSTTRSTWTCSARPGRTGSTRRTPTSGSSSRLLRIDHVTVAGADLAPLRHALAAAGLEAAYGGLHSNGVTHMALLGFGDGSYLELIASARPGVRAPWWPDHIAADGGPCAWAIRSADVAADAAAFRARGIPVRGPTTMRRERPDGRMAEFSLAFPGDGEPGTLLPFLIQDVTARALRVEPGASAAHAGITGVAGVTLGVRDLAAATALFRRAFDWPPPVAAGGGADPVLAHFPGTPVTLAAPGHGDTPLARRLARLGDGPTTFALRSRQPVPDGSPLHGLTALGLTLDPARPRPASDPQEGRTA